MTLRPKSYIKKPKNIEYVPQTFKFQDTSPYPKDNSEDFEWWLCRNLRDADIPSEWTYLPITWTAYYKKANYAGDAQKMQQLQNFIYTLDDTKHYFTICQWDDGILTNVSRLSLFQFNMGTYGDYQLPLICQPHAHQFSGITKDIPVSFVGRITHPIRQMIMDKYTSMPRWYISTQQHSMNDFCKILARSKYVLCPRGYGLTSFRIAEALQYGAHAIYPSDHHLDPHGQLQYEITRISMDEINMIPDLVKNEPNPKDAVRLFNSHYTYEANKKLIIEQLKNMV